MKYKKLFIAPILGVFLFSSKTIYADSTSRPQSIIVGGQEIQFGGVTPVSETFLDFEDRVKIVRQYLLDFDEPTAIPQMDFIQDRYSFILESLISLGIERNARPQTKTLEIETRTSDINEIMQSINDTYFWEWEDYSGELNIVLDSIQTVPMETRYERRTLTERQTYFNIMYGDISSIARTITKNGVTHTLSDIVWSENSEPIDFRTVPRTYNATAIYTGVYSAAVIPGFITTVTYTGEVARTGESPRFIYEATFVAGKSGEPLDIGEKLEGNDELNELDNTEHEDNTVSENQPITSGNRNTVGGLVFIAVLLLGALGFILFKIGKLKMPNLNNLLSKKNSTTSYEIDDDDAEIEEPDFYGEE